MPRGFTDITLVGGKRDGEVFEEVPLYNLPNIIGFDSKTFFAETETGDMAIYKGEINDLWHSFSREIYTKRANEKHKTGIVFEFTETLMIERCTAQTKAGKRCLKPAINGEVYCSSVHKPKC